MTYPATRHAREAVAPAGKKWCFELKEYRPLAEFGKDRSHKDGLNIRCRAGQALYDAERRRRAHAR